MSLWEYCLKSCELFKERITIYNDTIALIADYIHIKNQVSI